MIYPIEHEQNPIMFQAFITKCFSENGVKYCLPVKQIPNPEWKAGDDPKKQYKMLGTKSSLTKGNFVELHNKKQTTLAENKIFKPLLSIQDATHIELNMRAVHDTFCVDIDNKNMIWDEIPIEILKCPYIKSRNKILPHFYFRISGIDTEAMKTKYGGGFGSKNMAFAEYTFESADVDFLSSHTWERKDATVYNWNHEPLPVLEWNYIRKYLKKDIVNKIDTFKITEEVEEESENESTTEEEVSDDETEPALEFSTVEEKFFAACFAERLFSEEAKEYKAWWTFGSKIKSLTKNFELFDIFSKLNMSKYKGRNDCESYWKNMKPNPDWSFHKVKNDAKKENPEIYGRIAAKLGLNLKIKATKALAMLEKSKPVVTSSLSEKQQATLRELIFDNGDYRIAVAYNSFYGEIIKNIDKKQWYEFGASRIWEKSDGNNVRKRISLDFANQLRGFAESLNDKEEQAKIMEVYMKLSKTYEKQNIMTELAEVCRDEHFSDDMNKEKNVLPIKNGKMLNMNTLEVYERTIANKFSFECNAEYIPNLTKEQFDFADKYFNDLFCNRKPLKDCMLDILKSIFTGNTLRYVFCMTGEGSNGKSLLLKLLNMIFKGTMDTLSKLVFVKQKGQQPNINTEIEKCDKIRVGFVSELSKDDHMNTQSTKAISGGDPIDLRGLHKTNVTINPTVNLIMATNDLPQFDSDDIAFINRIVNCPFDNKFPINSEFETELMSKRDWIFSYIIKYGTTRDSFDFPEEMLKAKQDWIRENDKNHLRDFIAARVIVKEGNTIAFHDFRREFIKWCRTNDYRVDTEKSQSKFTRDLKRLKIENNDNHKGNVAYINVAWKPMVEIEDEDDEEDEE